MALFVVDTLVSYRMRYIIEANSLDDAYDEVVMNESAHEFEEFSQKCLGETIIDGRKISKRKFEKMNSELNSTHSNETGSPWMGDKQIHRIKY